MESSFYHFVSFLSSVLSLHMAIVTVSHPGAESQLDDSAREYKLALLFVFSIGEPKQNAGRSLFTPVSLSATVSMLFHMHGSLGFALHA